MMKAGLVVNAFSYSGGQGRKVSVGAQEFKPTLGSVVVPILKIKATMIRLLCIKAIDGGRQIPTFSKYV